MRRLTMSASFILAGLVACSARTDEETSTPSAFTEIAPITTSSSTTLPTLSETPEATNEIAAPITIPIQQSPDASEPLPDIGPFLAVAHFPPVESRFPFIKLLAEEDMLYAVVDGAEAYVYPFDKDEWSLLANNPPASMIGIDHAGRVWAASPERAAVYEANNWMEFGSDAGWSLDPKNYAVRHFLAASNGEIWITTDRDVRAFDGEKWEVFTYADISMTPPGGDPDSVFSVFSLAETEGTIWIGECTFSGPGPAGGVGARWFDGLAWSGLDSPAASGCVTAIAIAPDSGVWLDIGPELYRYDLQRQAWRGWRLPEPPDGATSFGEVSDITFDANGDPWLELTTCGGASCYRGYVRYHFEDGVWEQVGPEIGTHSQLFFDEQGRGWLFGEGNVSLMGIDLPVHAPTIEAVAQDENGEIWIIAQIEEKRGLWRLNP